jgi:hypothetical protein
MALDQQRGARGQGSGGRKKEEAVKIERLPRPERIKLAKAKMQRVLDHFLYLLELHANNSFVVFSPVLASQIPYSYAANAFRVFRRSMYQIEIVRLCALWDGVDLDKENIPTVVKLIDDDEIIEMLAEETRSHYMSGAAFGAVVNPDNDEVIAYEMDKERQASIDPQYADVRASLARTELRQAIADTRAVLGSARLASVMNIRNKHLAHSLERTHREKSGPVQPMAEGDETELLNASMPIVEHLYCCVTGTARGFSIANSQKIDQHNAEALWTGCKFIDLR